MIRYLKSLILAALALGALGAVGATGAQATHTEGHFETPGFEGPTTITSTKDGTAKTAHHVFDIRKADGTGTRSLTCEELALDGRVDEETFDEVTLTVAFQGNCQFLGQSISIDPGACVFNFTADGTVHIETHEGSGADECKHGEEAITFGTPTCHTEWGEQTIEGIGYHSIEVGGVQMITFSMNNLSFEYLATGPDCPYGTTANGLYTTGNTILTAAETNTTHKMVNVEWTAI